MSTFGTNWYEPLSPHLLHQAPGNPVIAKKDGRLSLWTRPIRLEGPRRHSAKATVLAPPAASDSRAQPLNSFARDDRAASAAKTEVTRARDLRSADVISVSPNTSVQEIADLLVQKRISSVPIIDAAGRLVGIVSEGDLIRRAEIGTEPLRSWWRRLLTELHVVAENTPGVLAVKDRLQRLSTYI